MSKTTSDEQYAWLPPTIFDFPSALLSNKIAFLLREKALFQVSHEILDSESKLLQIQTSTFLHFRWMAWVQFSKMYIYVNEVTLLTYFP